MKYIGLALVVIAAAWSMLVLHLHRETFLDNASVTAMLGGGSLALIGFVMVITGEAGERRRRKEQERQ